MSFQTVRRQVAPAAAGSERIAAVQAELESHKAKTDSHEALKVSRKEVCRYKNRS